MLFVYMTITHRTLSCRRIPSAFRRQSAGSLPGNFQMVVLFMVKGVPQKRMDLKWFANIWRYTVFKRNCPCTVILQYKPSHVIEFFTVNCWKSC
jgi:hypothetical protein